MASSSPGGEISCVQIQTLEVFPEELLRTLAMRLSRRLGIPCRLLPSLQDYPLPIIPGRHQADADRILHELEAREVPSGSLRVALTQQDLGIPIFTHVFGLARLGGSVSLISLARLDPGFYGLPRDPDQLLRRAVAEILHELGHNCGLEHCRLPDCLMRFSANVENIDMRGDLFCQACTRLFPAGFLARSVG